MAICKLKQNESKDGQPFCGARPGQRLIALHWQGNPEHEHTLYSRGRSIPFNHLLVLGQLVDVEFVSIQKGAGSEQCQTNCGLDFVAGQENVSESMDFIHRCCAREL